MSDLILLVDDDPDTRGWLGLALEQAGYEVALAADGAEGVAVADARRPGLVLMDAAMPGLSGFQACSQIKAAPQTSHIPVVFMTGLSATEHVVEGFRAGGVDYVTKPVVLDELLARIRVHLANAQMSISARAALDVSGRALLASDDAGKVLWRTPQAVKLLDELTPGAMEAAPPEVLSVLRALLAEPRDANAPPLVVQVGARRLQVAFAGRAAGEAYFRLSLPLEGREEALLRDYLKLTAREADVLLWISRGKSNRDISEILNISARTVNKHLEQVFTKLGVENRAAAAAIATRIVIAHG
ncbi:response regulator [Phenylobacterium sp.]|uniref:response regulator n=1 Tax=Phenylobacterium sp. TaxID=1871053 RepID=UPI002733CFAB|nr:response regulator [Phenylobacterium sp.]MDP3660317.1 response regulator [Phenylobacterium sp.]